MRPFTSSRPVVTGVIAAIALGGAMMLMGTPAHADVLLYDGFDYSGIRGDGTGIGFGTDADGGTGNWDGAWSGNLRWISTGLTYTTSGGTLVTTGGAVADPLTNTEFSAARDYTSATIGADDTVWFSFLVKYDAGLFDQVKFATDETGTPNSANGFGTRAGAGNINNGELEPMINQNRGGGATALDVSDGQTHFIVGKMELSSTGDDTLSLWYDIDLSETEGTLGLPDGTVTANLTIDSDTFSISSGGGSAGIYDEIRLGESLADVTPIPEPASGLGVVAFGVIAMLKRRRR